jgi:hypothetical protein
MVEGEEEFTLESATIRVPDRLITIDFAKDVAMPVAIEQQFKGDESHGLSGLILDMAARGRFKFFAVDPSTPEDGFAESVNVIIQEVDPGLALATAVEANLSESRTIAAVLSIDEFVEGELTFGRVRTGMEMEQRRCEGQACLLVRGGKSHCVTFTASPATAEKFFAEAETIMRHDRVR